MQNTAHWFSMGNEFVSQGMSNNERRHLWLSRLGGWGEVMLVLWWTEAKNAAKHPTVLGTASHSKNLSRLRLRNSGVRDQRGTKAYKDSSPPKALGPGGHDNKARGMLCARQGEHYKDKAKRPWTEEAPGAANG